MKKYRVAFSDDAKRDISRSYEWGKERWGTVAAADWYRKLKIQTRKILSQFPLSQPLAPESEDVSGEIRQMTFGRYRILFEIIGDTVRILHVRGAFVDNEIIDLGVDE